MAPSKKESDLFTQESFDFDRKPFLNQGLFCRHVIDRFSGKHADRQELPLFAPEDSLISTCRTHPAGIAASLGFTSQPVSGSAGFFELGTPGLFPSQPLILAAVENIGASATARLLDIMRAKNAAWGIITDCTTWRLHNKDVFSPFEHCYEIDLPRILDSRDAADSRYFTQFFSASAHIRNGRKPSFLDSAFNESQLAREALAGKLKEAAPRAVSAICKGFIRHERETTGAIPAGEGLDMIFRHSLVLVYRILLLMLLESRGTLPLGEPEYERRSMSRFAADTKAAFDSITEDIPATYASWGALDSMFERAYRGDRDIGATPLTGEFFNPEQHPFLTRNRADDFHIIAAIKEINSAVEVCEADLGELHSCHVSDALSAVPLYMLRIAEEPLLRIIDRGREICVTPSQTKWKTVLEKIDRGDVYVEMMPEPALDRIAMPHPAADALVRSATVMHRAVSFGEPPMFYIPFCGAGQLPLAAAVQAAETLAAAEQERGYTACKHRAVQCSVFASDHDAYMAETARFALWHFATAPGCPPPAIEHRVISGNPLPGTAVAELISDDIPDSAAASEAVRGTLSAIAAETRAAEAIEASNYGEARRREAASKKLIRRSHEAALPADIFYKSRTASKTAAQQLLASLAQITTDPKNRPKPEKQSVPPRDTSIPLHIEWAFPSVFFAPGGNSGFDAVLFAAPAKTRLDSATRNIIGKKYGIKGSSAFAEALARCMAPMLSAEGSFGFIVPSAFPSSVKAAKLKEALDMLFDMYSAAHDGDQAPSAPGHAFFIMKRTAAPPASPDAGEA